MTCLVWFRLDIRITDHPALEAAAELGGPVVPIFIYAPTEEAPWEPGKASCWWWHQSPKSLEAQLRQIGLRLVIRRGPSLETLRKLVHETRASAVFWNRRYEPSVIARDQKIKDALRRDGLKVESYNAALLHEPWMVQNRSGKPFQVFTPFWRHCLNLPDPAALIPAPNRLPAPAKWPESEPLAQLQLEPNIDWAAGLRSAWKPGEAGAADNLAKFLHDAFDTYSEARNRPDVTGTSRLSPHLHFGEISPRQVWHGVRQAADKRGFPGENWRGSQFLAEIGWREFGYHLLYHFPHTPSEPLRGEFKAFPWRENASWLEAWQKGRTGYPIVDAGMRELWTTGWMHNRVRMIVASFLVKDLLISWEAGARWFWDTLVDADLASNTLGWQWSAGCGADAAPFLRVFNPISQGAKFDPNGNYVRRWCPELAKLPAAWIHQPDKAPPDVLPGMETLGYPVPIVSHGIAREAALNAFAQLSGRPKGHPKLR